MNLKRKDNNKKDKDKTKLSTSWPPSQILSSRTKKNKSDFKIKKCWGTLKINSKRKSKKKKEKNKNKKTKRNIWEITWPAKFNKKKPRKLKKRKSIPSKPTSGRKTLQTFWTMKKTRPSTWNKCISNTKVSWSNKWSRRKTTKTERKWTHWSYFTTRPWWKQLESKTSMSKRQNFEVFYTISDWIIFIVNKLLGKKVLYVLWK